MLRIAILGSGALASYFAARLHEKAEVHMFGHWKARLNALKSEGLSLTERDGSKSQVQLRVSELNDFPHYFDVVLVLVKAWQTPEAAKEASQLIAKKPSAFVLSLQNGIGNVPQLKSEVDQSVFAGTTLQGAKINGLAGVAASGTGSIFLPSSIDSGFIEILRIAGFEVHLADDLVSLLWSKLLINAAINPLTGAFGITNGTLLKSASLKAFLGDLALEVAELAKAKSIDLLYTDPVAEVERVALDTEENTSSMLADLRRGAPTELEAITGFLLQEAGLQGLSLPQNKVVYQWMKEKLAGQVPSDAVYQSIAQELANAG
ncbi:MAG: ketopantoate reductase family protein [Bacteroidetes bacterium]|nr:MAG: ketopantoate reductase family protein [Bacteroidota bacterium]